MEFDLSPSPSRTKHLANPPVPGYDENVWTPTLTFGGLSTGITYDTQNGSFVKIGRFCVAHALIRLTSKGSATLHAEIAGLPFQLAPTIHGGVPAVGSCLWSGMTTAFVTIVPFLPANASAIRLNGLTAAGTGPVELVDSDFANTTELHVTIAFRIGEYRRKL